MRLPRSSRHWVRSPSYYVGSARARFSWTSMDRCMRLALSLRLWLYAVTASLFASGVLWLVAHYFATPNSWPRLPAVSMRFHGGAAMLMLVLVGITTALHVPQAWRERKNRL